MLRTFDPAGERDLVFVPVGINYDRTLEDRTLLLDVAPAAARRPGKVRALGTTLRFVLRQVSLAARSRWHRFGYACVTFGSPISMRRMLRERQLDLRTLPAAEQPELPLLRYYANSIAHFAAMSEGKPVVAPPPALGAAPAAAAATQLGVPGTVSST